MSGIRCFSEEATNCLKWKCWVTINKSRLVIETETPTRIFGVGGLTEQLWDLRIQMALMAHFLYYNGSQSVVLGPGASASASAGTQWETQITGLTKNLSSQELCGWSPAICVFNKPARQFLHTLTFENYCSIKARYFQTNFLIFLYFNVKLTINGQGNVFKGNWEEKWSWNPQDIHTRLKAVILNPSWILEWLKRLEICQDLIPSQMKQIGGEGGSSNICF